MDWRVWGLFTVNGSSSCFLGYGVLASQASRLARQPRYAVIADRVAGTLLIGAGLGLASARR
jgi:threonine/homoserine/homoserine lactone efflux protein